MKEDILVSIICTAYNHEKFIRYALDGFLMQKTNFKYEILIHDDASTDKTASIIKEYEVKYPDLIKAIYQEENQYSRGNNVNFILLERAKGKYLAFCEGDDYWIDENKLQKQVDFLKKNINYSAVYHNVLVIDENNVEYKEEQYNFPFHDEYTVRKKELYPGTLCGQLASLVCINFWKELVKNKSEYSSCKVNGDVKLNLFLSMYGNIKYFKEIMSCYRRTYSGDSWNSRIKGKDLSMYHYNSINSMFKMIKELFNIEISSQYIKNAKCRIIADYLVKLLKFKGKRNLKIFCNLYRYCDVKIYFIYYFSLKVIIHYLRKVNMIAKTPQINCVAESKFEINVYEKDNNF